MQYNYKHSGFQCDTDVSFYAHGYLGAYDATFETVNLRDRAWLLMVTRRMWVRLKKTRGRDPGQVVLFRSEGRLPGHPQAPRWLDCWQLAGNCLVDLAVQLRSLDTRRASLECFPSESLCHSYGSIRSKFSRFGKAKEAMRTRLA